MKFLAPAKINLFLKIVSKREDKYHNIKTILQTIGLCDEIYISSKKSEIDFDYKTNDVNGEIKPEQNLAYCAAVLLKEHLNEQKGANIKLIKNIPVGAGLGGGSSDAATVLKGLTKIWHRKVTLKTLSKLGCKLGTDVPFFLYNGCCLAEGIGEEITKLHISRQKKHLWVMLVYPEFSISTKEVYDKFRRQCTVNSKQETENFIFRIKKNKTIRLSDVKFTNDLEQVVFKQYPELMDIKHTLKSFGAISLMSGSGSTIFGIFQSKKAGQSALRYFKKNTHYRTWLCQFV